MTEKPLVIVITGPTGSGKTKLSISLAKALNCSIVSSDSRQIFKEIPIGSAAPDEDELKQVKHYFVGSHSIHEPMNAGIYEALALSKLQDLFNENPIQIVCGGTGLYIKALLYGLDDIPKASEALREQLKEEWEQDSQKLIHELRIKDPIYASSADLNNKQRVLRALEVIRETSLPFSSFRTRKTITRPFNHVILSIDIAREELYERINLRTTKMMNQGWLKEAKAVYPFRVLNSLQTVGFKELFEFFDGKISLEEATEKIKMNTRRYAKRQITWVKNQETALSISPEESSESILLKLKGFIS